MQEPTWFNKTGNIVEAEEEAFVLKSKYFHLYPEKLLFVDEVGFTAANGEPVMCAVIFAVKEFEPMMVQGLDPFATWEGDELEIERNTGLGE